MDSKCVIYDSKELTRLGIINGQTLEKILKKINASFCEVDTAIDDAFIGTNTGVGAEIYKDTNAYDEEEFRTLIGKGGIKIEQKSDEIEVIIDEDWIKQYYPKFSIKNIGDGVNLVNEYQPNKYEAKTIKSSDNSVVVSVDSLGGLDIKVNAVELKTASYDKIIPSSSSITIDKNGAFSSDSIYTKVIKSSIESIGETIEGQLKYKFDNESDFTNIDFNQRLYVADKPNVKYVDFAYYPEDSLEPTDKQTVTFVREGKDGAKGDTRQNGKDGENGNSGSGGFFPTLGRGGECIMFTRHDGGTTNVTDLYSTVMVYTGGGTIYMPPMNTVASGKWNKQVLQKVKIIMLVDTTTTVSSLYNEFEFAGVPSVTFSSRGLYEFFWDGYFWRQFKIAMQA